MTLNEQEAKQILTMYNNAVSCIGDLVGQRFVLEKEIAELRDRPEAIEVRGDALRVGDLIVRSGVPRITAITPVDDLIYLALDDTETTPVYPKSLFLVIRGAKEGQYVSLY